MSTKIKRRWYVMNAIEGLPSWNPKTDTHEVFWTRKKAIKRAHELAEMTPQVDFHVCATMDVVFVETKPVKQISVTE